MHVSHLSFLSSQGKFTGSFLWDGGSNAPCYDMIPLSLRVVVQVLYNTIHLKVSGDLEGPEYSLDAKHR